MHLCELRSVVGDCCPAQNHHGIQDLRVLMGTESAVMKCHLVDDCAIRQLVSFEFEHIIAGLIWTLVVWRTSKHMIYCRHSSHP